MIDVSVIIVTWNSRADLERCLPSLKAGLQKHTSEVILVDNASGDGTTSLARSILPEARIIQNSANVGFAAANNQALASAAGRYVCLLNPDTIVYDHGLDALVDFMEGNPRAWASGPAMYNSDGSAQRTGVRFPSLWNLAVETLFLDRIFPSSRIFGAHRELFRSSATARPVDYVQGACLMVRREAVEKVGGMDERFFMYFEETDWCYRFKEAGGEVWLVPSAGVVHIGGGTTGHFDEHRLAFYFESLLRFYDKHHGAIPRAAVRVLVLLRSLSRIPVWILIGIAKPQLRAAARSSCRGYARVIRTVVRTGGDR
ncbi:MAG: glycosyltransferase family 2 protein [Bacteroidetes bacterium]|nr:glycosyltransferase family 2 protein [Bacteroidota bacterium]